MRRLHDVTAVAIKTVAGDTVKQSEKGSFLWNVGKDNAIGKLKAAIEFGQLKAFSFQIDLRKEFELYTAEQKRNNGHHFDILMALKDAVRLAMKYGYLRIYEKTGEEKYLDLTMGDRYNGKEFDFMAWRMEQND